MNDNRQPIYYNKHDFAQIMRAMGEKFEIKHPQLVELRRHIETIYAQRPELSGLTIAEVALFVLKNKLISGNSVQNVLDTDPKDLYLELKRSKRLL